jgi:hypothetical protein
MAGEMGTVADCETSCCTNRGISYIASASGQEQTVKSVGLLGYLGDAVIRHRVMFRYLASGHFVSHSFRSCCSLLLGHRKIREGRQERGGGVIYVERDLYLRSRVIFWASNENG